MQKAAVDDAERDPQIMIPHSRVRLGQVEIDAALEVLRSGQINDSDVTREFEDRVARYIGRRFAWSTTTGTLAIYVSLRLLEVGPGDEVLIPTYVCDDVLSAVLQAGATAVPVDMAEDFNIDPRDMETKVSRRTKAAVLVHMFGLPLPPESFDIGAVATIEDCAQSFNASVDGRSCGTFGDLSTFSFHALKLLPAGEGGLVTTDKGDLADKFDRYKAPDFSRSEHRMDYHLSNIHSALGLAALEQWSKQQSRRKELAEHYTEALSALRNARLPCRSHAGREPSWLRYCLLLEDDQEFPELEDRFLEQGVVVRRPVKTLNHRLLGLPDSHCPVAARLFDRVLSIPFYPNLSDREVEKVLQTTLELVA